VSASAAAAAISRGRRGGAQSGPSAKRPSGNQRKRVTDPATLEKRRAALAKARKALAAKRAAAKKAG